MDNYERHGSPHVLVSELATANPGAFKKTLIGGLERHSPQLAKAFNKASHLGLTSSDDISLNASGWLSRSGEGRRISLGVAPLPSEERERLLFEDRTFSYPKEVSYRLGHELTHKLSGNLYTNHTSYGNLYKTVEGLRSQADNKGFSSLGSLPHYQRQGPDIQAKEDMIELANMYLLDPKYLQRFLGFLASPDFAEQRNRLKLATITPETSDNIYAIIGGVVDQEILRDT